VNGAPPAWVRRALDAYARWIAAAPAPLTDRLARVHALIASRQGAGSVLGALTSPFTTPWLALLEAYREDLGLPDAGAIDAVAEGTLGLYFYLRIQDDVIDTPATSDPSYLYAAEIFAGASAEAFARVAGARPAFWALRRQILDELAATSAWEIDTYRRMDPAEAAERLEEHATLLGSKLMPLAIPLAALGLEGGKDGAFDWIGPFSRSFGAALQIENDLLNARDDHAAGRLTPSLVALYAGGRVTRDGQSHLVWPTLVGDPALTRMIHAARAHIEAAVARATEAGAPAVAAVAARRLSTLGEIAPRLLRLTLGVHA
jgi:hypothetical protein